MKIVVTGLRGFPYIQGGIETHCEELYPRIAQSGCDVTVIRRRCFVAENPPLMSYKGVKFKDLSAPNIIGLEAALHTLKGVFYAFWQHADIVHIHAIGPSLAVPFAKLLGLKVVVTHHGPDYDREKWGWFAKFFLKTGEYFAAKMADEIIIISTVIGSILEKKYQCTNTHLIYNGVNIPIPKEGTQYINKLGLTSKKYILAVGRFVEEKRFDKLIEAYASLGKCGFSLVIAGDADHETSFSKNLKEQAQNNHVILTGMLKGNKLAELYTHAAVFVLPSTHEGLPITLLEAMSYNLDVLASNIPANLAVELPQDCYFQVDDLTDLSAKLQKKLQNSPQEPFYDLSPYNWDHIAEKTLKVYKKLIPNKNN